MKKSKQNNVEPKSKKGSKEKSAISNIESYFQPTQKEFVVTNDNNNGSHAQNIYVEALKKKLRDAKEVFQPLENTKKDGSSKQVGACEVIHGKSRAEEDRPSKQLGASCVDQQNIRAEEMEKTLEGVLDAIQSSNKGDRLNNQVYGMVDCERSAMEDCASNRVGVHCPATIRSGAENVAKPTECARAECVEKALECREWERKYKEMKRVYLNLTINYAEENIKYKNLLKVATRTTHPDNNEVVKSGDSMFTQNEINALERIPLVKPKDSTFVMESLEYLYKDDLSVLCHRSVKGTSEKVEFSADGEEMKRHPGKKAMTPEKYDCVKELFIERISKCVVDPDEHGKRLDVANIRRLLASGIKNIAKKQPHEM